jgi:ABC-type bacteriocin/lantibiotic exporter with double-glycine peptidase domain
MYRTTRLLQLLALQVSSSDTLNSLLGCGKSSIISLIERFYDPVEGQLLYNDADLKEIDNK